MTKCLERGGPSNLYCDLEKGHEVLGNPNFISRHNFALALLDADQCKHYTPDKNKPICIHCGLADIAGDWEKYPCNDDWRKEIATNYRQVGQ